MNKHRDREMTRPLMSPISSPSSCDGMSDEEFNIFHAIDRILYSRLVLNLGREPAESMQVMGLWLWLEREVHHSHLVKQLISLPASSLNSLADETLTCLKCIDTSFDPHNSKNDIPLLKKVLGKNNTSNKVLSLRYFYENRIGVLRGVATIVSEVCVRAFQDIWRCYGAGNRRLLVVEEGGGVEEIHSGLVLLPSDDDDVWRDRIGDPNQIVQGINCDCHLVMESRFLDDKVPPDDRTIFLTFSKGYPISDVEVRHFFTRKFGEIIEAIYMQEVGINEQSLYARLVLRSVSAINVVLDGQSKAKFTINGKHLWARKYLRKKKIKNP